MDVGPAQHEHVGHAAVRRDARQLRLSHLTDPKITRIAMANPKHAPYGQRAVEALRAAGVWSQVESKLVYGDNIAQTAQFVQTGNAQVGIIALALAVNPTLSRQGGYWLIPDHLHSPLAQGFLQAELDSGGLHDVLVDSAGTHAWPGNEPPEREAVFEAARAGNAGEGFAVVSTEVRNLAMRAAAAARDTAARIEEVIASVRCASTAQVDAAVAGVKAAFTAVKLEPHERYRLLSRVASTQNSPTWGCFSWWASPSGPPRRAAPSKAAPPRGAATRAAAECGGYRSPERSAGRSSTRTPPYSTRIQPFAVSAARASFTRWRDRPTR